MTSVYHEVKILSRLKKDREDVADDPHLGCPQTTKNDENNER